MRRWFPVLALVVGATLLMSREAGGATPRGQRAEALFADANRRLAIGTHEQRQFARTDSFGSSSRIFPSFVVTTFFMTTPLFLITPLLVH